MKAIVHIGTEKTGTTSIQSFLYQNRSKLNVAGFHILQGAGKENNRAVPAYCIDEASPDDYFWKQGIETLEQRRQFKKDFLKTFDREVSRLPKNINTVIISSEHFHSRIRTAEELNNLFELLSRYFDDIKIVCYLREQATTCQSYYSTSLKNGDTLSFSDFLDQRCKPENIYFNYDDMLANWERCFGLQSLDISLFIQERFLNGDLLDDFTAKIDPALLGTLKKPDKPQNQSLTPFGQALLRAINMILPARKAYSDVHILGDECKKIINHNLRGAGQGPTSEQRISIYNSFIESNARVQQKFFPEEFSLFASPDNLTIPGVKIDGAELDVLIDVLNCIAEHEKKQSSESDYARICTCFFLCINEITNLTSKRNDEAASHGNSSVLEKTAHTLRDLALRVDARDVRLALILMNLAERIGSDLPDMSEKITEYQRRIARVPLQKFIFMYTLGPDLPEVQKGPLGEALRLWVLTLPVPSGSLFTPIESTKVLGSQGMLDDDNTPSYQAYTLIESESLSEACAIAQQCPLIPFGGRVQVLELSTLRDE